jgi:transketolase
MAYRLINKSEFDRVRNSGGEWAQKMQLFADMCRYNTLVAVKKAGSGHLGSSLSAMDLATYLYLNKLNVLQVGLDSPNRDIYFSSKGHDVPGLYSLFYALGILPADKLLMLRRLHGLDGHPEVRVPGIEASTGSLGMGISKGKGMAWAKRYAANEGHVYVLTGDGEFQEGQIYESIQAAAHQRIGNLTAVMDHNKYQTDMLVRDVNNIEDVVTKVAAFGWHVVRIDGHDFGELKKTFGDLAAITDRPKMIVADTVKGKGVSFMERPETESTSGKTYYKWHSGAPDDESYSKGLAELKETINALASALGIAPISVPDNAAEGKVSSKAVKEFVTEAYGDALCEIAEQNNRLPRQVHRERHRGAGHGLDGRRPCPYGPDSGCEYICELPRRQSKRTDIQQRRREVKSDLHLSFLRDHSGGTREIPPECARYLAFRSPAKRHNPATMQRGGDKSGRQLLYQ